MFGSVTCVRGKSSYEESGAIVLVWMLNQPSKKFALDPETLFPTPGEGSAWIFRLETDVLGQYIIQRQSLPKADGDYGVLVVSPRHSDVPSVEVLKVIEPYFVDATALFADRPIHFAVVKIEAGEILEHNVAFEAEKMDMPNGKEPVAAAKSTAGESPPTDPLSNGESGSSPEAGNEDS
jgi:hypothetical protein